MSNKIDRTHIYMQIGILLAVCFAADLLVSFLPFSFPVNVTAMILLMLMLWLRAVKISQVEQIGDLLIDNMTIMFLPSSCALMTSYKYIINCLPSFIFICFVSTLITWLVTFATISLVIKIQQNHRNKKAGVNHG